MAHSTEIAPADFTPTGRALDAIPSQPLDPDTRVNYRQAAVLVANRVETEALGTSDPAGTLANILGALPALFPQAVKNSGTPDVEAIAPMLQPEVTARLKAYEVLHRGRKTAVGAHIEALDLMIGALRGGADPKALGEQVIELLTHGASDRKRRA
ncbi:hypothetical protein ABT167_28720 [Streptomyces sp. NPDC001792]|uniref:hypothetical protein n=1 Tax=Streptomyces sp. NPDC001792 TaxID=3154524 RepID=UPI003333B822